MSDYIHECEALSKLARESIDRIDSKSTKFIVQRLTRAASSAKIKIKHNLSIRTDDRQQPIVDRTIEDPVGLCDKNDVVNVFSAIFRDEANQQQSYQKETET